MENNVQSETPSFWAEYLSEIIDSWFLSASHSCHKLYAKMVGIILYTLVIVSGYSIYPIWDTICSMEEDMKIFEGMI